MNASILLNCRARKNRASEREKKKRVRTKERERKGEQERARDREKKITKKKEKKFGIRKGAFPFDDDAKKKEGNVSLFFFSIVVSV